MMNDLLAFPCALDMERPKALFRHLPEDFFVDEQLGFELTGEGEHLWLQVEKTGLNTMDVVNKLSELSGVKARDIGFAGLKDKQAVTRQWFSIKTSKDFGNEDFGKDSKLKVLAQSRNAKKLRRGSHHSNQFRIHLRQIQGDLSELQSNKKLGAMGVPNYFGLQRFGKEGANLEQAKSLLNGTLNRCSRFKQGLYLSAARSFLFNQVLASRVRENTWNDYVAGDVMSLEGSASVFLSEKDDAQLASRLAEGDIHPTGPLWGKGNLKCQDDVQELEVSIAKKFPEFTALLEVAGLKQERRALRLKPENLSLMANGADELVVEFSLPKGGYATSVLRELVDAPGL